MTKADCYSMGSLKKKLWESRITKFCTEWNPPWITHCCLRSKNTPTENLTLNSPITNLYEIKKWWNFKNHYLVCRSQDYEKKESRPRGSGKSRLLYPIDEKQVPPVCVSNFELKVFGNSQEWGLEASQPSAVKFFSAFTIKPSSLWRGKL